MKIHKVLLVVLMVLWSTVASAAFVNLHGSLVDLSGFRTIECREVLSVKDDWWNFHSWSVVGSTGETTDNWWSGQSNVEIVLVHDLPNEVACREVLEKAQAQLTKEK